MNTRKYNIFSILATGVVVLVLLSLSLFWLRFLVSVRRRALLPSTPLSVTVPLSPRLWGLTEKPDPNQSFPAMVQGTTGSGFDFLVGLGAPHYVWTWLPWLLGGAAQSPIYRWDELGGPLLYYDSSLGQIGYKAIEVTRREDGTTTERHVAYYAGPEGIGSEPDPKHGRFRSLVVDPLCLNPQIVYDRVLRRFFAIRWRQQEQTVQPGPQLADDDPHQPVQIRVLTKRMLLVQARILPGHPLRGEDTPKPIHWESYLLPSGRLLVLDASGRIDLLDQQKLEYVHSAGALPVPPGLFDSARAVRPEDLAAYDVKPFLIPGRGGDWERRDGGWAVASLSREGLALQLSVFDPNGRPIAGRETEITQYVALGGAQQAPISSTRAAYFTLPGAQVLTGAKFVLENLHPPVLLLLSYVAGPHLEATASYRSLFLLPDSFVAMAARDAGGTLIDRIFLGVLLGFPAVLFAAWLALRVGRDARRTGLSKNTRLAWRIATVIFGLPAYITYRLMRPQVTLVTCANCGVGRRPDQEKCHHCGSPWVVPELTPPAWRVLGEPDQAEENSFSREPQADSQVQ